MRTLFASLLAIALVACADDSGDAESGGTTEATCGFAGCTTTQDGGSTAASTAASSSDGPADTGASSTGAADGSSTGSGDTGATGTAGSTGGAGMLPCGDDLMCGMERPVCVESSAGPADAGGPTYECGPLPPMCDGVADPSCECVSPVACECSEPQPDLFEVVCALP